MNSDQLSCSLEGLYHISYLAQANMNGIPPTPNSPCPPGHTAVASVTNATGAQLSPPSPPPPLSLPPSSPFLHDRTEFPIPSHVIRTMSRSSCVALTGPANRPDASPPDLRCRHHRQLRRPSRHRHRCCRRIPSRRRPSRRRHQPLPAAVLSITYAAPVDGWLLHSPPAQQHTN